MLAAKEGCAARCAIPLIEVSFPRIGLPGLLTIGGGVLLFAIAVGNHMGNRVLNQVAGSNGGFVRNVMATPVPIETHAPAEVNWKKVQVMSVATDPAFPDPRVTPEPPPPPTAPPPPAPDLTAPDAAAPDVTPPDLAAPETKAPEPKARPIPPPRASARRRQPSPATSALDTPYPGPEAVESARRMEKNGP
jgi:hypothetical protein